MVAWVPDNTKRFRKRPHFKPEEIDRECEALTAGFLLKHRGKVEYPLSTNDLTVLIEQNVRELDVYADLSADGEDVEGVTRFIIGNRPVIEISEPLSTNQRRENRFRTTMAHELGHARLHDPLFQAAFSSGDLFEHAREARIVCKRETILDAPQRDWMEWQASYASGAYLMPRSALRDLLKPHIEHQGMPPYNASEPIADTLISAVVNGFQVSRDAARTRLSKLNYINNAPREPTLFG